MLVTSRLTIVQTFSLALLTFESTIVHTRTCTHTHTHINTLELLSPVLYSHGRHRFRGTHVPDDFFDDQYYQRLHAAHPRGGTVTCATVTATNGGAEPAEASTIVGMDSGSMSSLEPDEDLDGLRVPGRMWHKLFEYQRTGVRWLWSLCKQDAGQRNHLLEAEKLGCQLSELRKRVNVEH